MVHDEKYSDISDTELKKVFDEKYPNVKIEITEERLETIRDVCRAVHGDEFAKRCVARIRENGYINHVQRYFGLHYRADMMCEENDELLPIVEEFGFDWFKKYQPSGEK